MERLIEITYTDIHGNEVTDDAIVEFIRYDEDGNVVNEVVQVFLPEYIPQGDKKFYKDLITAVFHRGEGTNL